MTNTLHFSEWRNYIRAQRKVNLCAPGAPKGPKVGMVVRQYEMLCANDAGRAPRKYPAKTLAWTVLSYAAESWSLKMRDERNITSMEMWLWCRMKRI